MSMVVSFLNEKSCSPALKQENGTGYTSGNPVFGKQYLQAVQHIVQDSKCYVSSA
jgi:hypothetical protein